MRRIAVFCCALTSGLVLVTISVGLGGPPAPTPPPGLPFAGLAAADIARFNAGKDAFTQVEDVPGGLGPVFTEASCVKCHQAGATGGSGTRLVTRIGRVVNGVYDPMTEQGGPLIQDHGIGKFNGVNFVGEVVPKSATIVAQRRTTPLFGLGLVDNVPDETLIALADHQQLMDPATAGRVSEVDDPSATHKVGRFGWKAQHAALFAFAADAYTNEMGVTTPFSPNENCPQGNCALLAANPAANNPNDSDNSSIQKFTDFITLLAPAPAIPPPPPPAPGGRGPAGRGPGGGGGGVVSPVAAGQSLFMAMGCAKCHQPTLQTGPSSVAALSNVTFAPYSDFLLHDMGKLGDGITQNTAGPQEMRTAPLWGIRLETTFLHDGRAKTIPDAILAHDGQGRAARNNFTRLSPAQVNQLLAFLNSL